MFFKSLLLLDNSNRSLSTGIHPQSMGIHLQLENCSSKGQRTRKLCLRLQCRVPACGIHGQPHLNWKRNQNHNYSDWPPCSLHTWKPCRCLAQLVLEGRRKRLRLLRISPNITISNIGIRSVPFTAMKTSSSCSFHSPKIAVRKQSGLHSALKASQKQDVL